MDIGPLEIGLIVVAIVLIFGVGKLGDIGGALGKSIREFRTERDKKDDSPQTAKTEPQKEPDVAQSEVKTSTEKLCPKCGAKMSPKASFCRDCGAKL